MFEIKKLIYPVLFSVLIFAGCGKETSEEKNSGEESLAEEITLTKEQADQIRLKIEKAGYKPFAGEFVMPAKVITNQDSEAQVGSLVQGRVQKVFVKVGDHVKSGQILMYVEGLEIGEIKAAYVMAKSNLDYRKANYERQKVLIEQKVGSQKSLLEAQSEFEKAAAEFNAADKKIHSIGLTDDEVEETGTHAEEHTSGTLPIRSPISGIVTERNVVIGQLVDGTTNAFRIINTSSVWVDGQISERDVSKINNNSGVVFASHSFPEENFQGRISYIGEVIDEQSRTLTVRAEFNNRNNALKAQMFGEMKVSGSQNSKAILLPAESIVRFDNEDYVFVEKSPMTFQRKAVKTGSSINDRVEIVEGLSIDDKVVVKGSFYLKSEMMKSEFEEEE